MKLSKILRMGAAAVLAVSVPLSASVAATRPNAAVPVAGAAAAVQGSSNSTRASAPILPIAVIVATLLVGLYFALDSDKDGKGAFSRG